MSSNFQPGDHVWFILYDTKFPNIAEGTFSDHEWNRRDEPDRFVVTLEAGIPRYPMPTEVFKTQLAAARAVRQRLIRAKVRREKRASEIDRELWNIQATLQQLEYIIQRESA